MTRQDAKGRFRSLRRRGLAGQSAVLTAAVLVVYAAVSPVAGYIGGAMGMAAAAVAAGLCLAGAGLALVVCRLFRDPKRAFQGVLIGMFLRVGVPLLAALGIQAQGGGLAAAGLFVYLLVFYPVVLIVETALSLPPDDRPQRPGDASGNPVL